MLKFLSVLLPMLLCYVLVSWAYEFGVTNEECMSVSANCPDNYHGEPENFEPDNRFNINDNGEGVYQIEFQNREQDGSIVGYAFQVRNQGRIGMGSGPARGYVTITNLTYDRLWPCPASNGGPGVNGVTHANATKGRIDIEAGHTRNTVSFLWTATLTGGVIDDVQCARAIGSVVGENGFWWEHVTSDCFMNCDLCDDVTVAVPFSDEGV